MIYFLFQRETQNTQLNQASNLMHVSSNAFYFQLIIACTVHAKEINNYPQTKHSFAYLNFWESHSSQRKEIYIFCYNSFLSPTYHKIGKRREVTNEMVWELIGNKSILVDIKKIFTTNCLVYRNCIIVLVNLECEK